MRFRFHVDGSSGVPPYLQLVHQVRQSLLLGYLREGDRLPTVKEVAGDLAINPNTVVKAYRQLEHEGLAGGRPGQGTLIPGPPRDARRARSKPCGRRWSSGSATPRRPGSTTKR